MAASGLMSHRTGDTIERFHDSAKWPETVNHEFAGDVIMEDNVLQGVIIASKSGREAVYGKVAIDATGDGDIAAKAEVTYYKGRREDGSRQPLTLMVNVAGVDTQRAVLPGSFWVATRDHFNFDVHKNTDSGLDKIGLQKRFFQSYTIPYGCLLPQRSRQFAACRRKYFRHASCAFPFSGDAHLREYRAGGGSGRVFKCKATSRAAQANCGGYSGSFANAGRRTVESLAERGADLKGTLREASLYLYQKVGINAHECSDPFSQIPEAISPAGTAQFAVRSFGGGAGHGGTMAAEACNRPGDYRRTISTDLHPDAHACGLRSGKGLS